MAKLEYPERAACDRASGQTILTTPGDARLAAISACVIGDRIEGIVFQANAPETAAGVNGLIEIEDSTGITFRKCAFLNAAGNGIAANEFGGDDRGLRFRRRFGRGDPFAERRWA